MTTTPPPVPRRDPADVAGDIGDQAQDLQFALEAEAIAAALAGHPRGDDELDRDARIEPLEGEDPLDGLEEGDSSDDPLHGGDDITGTDPLPRPIGRALEEEDDESLAARADDEGFTG